MDGRPRCRTAGYCAQPNVPMSQRSPSRQRAEQQPEAAPPLCAGNRQCFCLLALAAQLLISRPGCPPASSVLGAPPRAASGDEPVPTSQLVGFFDTQLVGSSPRPCLAGRWHGTRSSCRQVVRAREPRCYSTVDPSGEPSRRCAAYRADYATHIYAPYVGPHRRSAPAARTRRHDLSCA
jgi:hypothetical protein